MTLILIATGQTIVVMRGGIDLSVGGILSLTTAICATRGDPRRWPSRSCWIAFILGLGAVIGVLNGVIITLRQAAALRGDACDLVDPRRRAR